MNNNASLLNNYIKKIGIELSDRQTEQFLLYYQFLLKKNEVMNLTTITDYHDVVIKHFADSLSLVKVLDLFEYKDVIDVGTGAGFPGIPLKIVFPHLHLTLLDSLKKRILFLNDLIELLELQHINAVHSRAEIAAHNSTYREHYDLCVSRAVTNLTSLSEYCIPFLRQRGLFVSYKSLNVNSEITNAEGALKVLGGNLKSKAEFYLPDTDIGRTFVIVEKTNITPLKYPRKAGLPTKEPL